MGTFFLNHANSHEKLQEQCYLSEEPAELETLAVPLLLLLQLIQPDILNIEETACIDTCPVLVKPVREVVVIVFRMDCLDVCLSGITGNMLFVRDCGCSDDDKLADNLVGYIKLIVDVVNFDLRLFSFVALFFYVLKQTLECSDIHLSNYCSNNFSIFAFTEDIGKVGPMKTC